MERDHTRAPADQQSLAALIDLPSLARAVLAQALDDIANGSWVEAHAAYAWLTSDDAVSHWMALAGFGVDVSRWRCLPLAHLRRLRGSPLFAELRAAA